jgi:hypothetical protein
MMRFSGLRIYRDGEKNEKSQCTTLYIRDGKQEQISKSFDQSWVYFFARFRGFEGYGYGSRRKRNG